MAWISKDGSHKHESFAYYSMDHLREYLAKKRRIVGPHPEGNCPHGCKDCFTKDSFVRPWPQTPEPCVIGLPPGMTAKTPEKWWKLKPLRNGSDEPAKWLETVRRKSKTFETMTPPKLRLLAPVKEELGISCASPERTSESPEGNNIQGDSMETSEENSMGNNMQGYSMGNNMQGDSMGTSEENSMSSEDSEQQNSEQYRYQPAALPSRSRRRRRRT